MANRDVCHIKGETASQHLLMEISWEGKTLCCKISSASREARTLDFLCEISYFGNPGWARKKLFGFVAESCLLLTICRLLSISLGSASPGYLGYPKLTISGPMIGATFADWTPVLFLIPLEEEVLLFRITQGCVWGSV